MKEKNAVLLISGYNPRAVIAFCRWAAQRDVPFHMIASGKTDSVWLTKYSEHVAITRESQELSVKVFLPWVNTIIQRYGYQKLVILPTTEYFNRFLLNNRAILEDEGCIIPLVGESLYVDISDKRKFADLCKSHEVDIPDEFEVLPAAPPFVAKPMTYFDSEGSSLYPHLIMSQRDYASFIESKRPENYFYQEFVRGESHYLLACFGKDGTYCLFSQENLIQQSRGKSVILARKSEYHQSKNAKKFIDMLLEIGFRGLIMIEVRRTEADKYVMIEANPRLWGPMQFIVDNQVEFFGMLLRDHGIDLNDSSGDGTLSEYYYWSGGITPLAQPLAFHNYSEEEFVKNLPEIRKHDVYLREDTLGIYLQELGIIE